MATKKSNGYESGNHQSNYGNSHVAILRHKFTAADKNGDVLLMGQFGFDQTIHRLTVSSDIGTSATMDVGYIGLESGEEKLDHFAAAVDVSEAGREEVNCAPFYMKDMGVNCDGDLKAGNNRGEIHDMTLKVNGAPKVDSCVFLHVEYIHNGH